MKWKVLKNFFCSFITFCYFILLTACADLHLGSLKADEAELRFIEGDLGSLG